MLKILLSLLLTFLPVKLIALDTEFDCLARNVYHEARGESYQGKIAVALVTLNRTEQAKFPKTICGVVYQKGQFSWTKNYSKIKMNAIQWEESKVAALDAYMNRNALGPFLATYFHNKSINPGWKLRKVAVIGGHTFYKV